MPDPNSDTDITRVEAAFDRLVAHAARYTDADTVWTIHAVNDDIIAILAGDWHGDESGDLADSPAALQLDSESSPF